VTAGLDVFTLPDLGEGLTEGTLVRWLVGPGDELTVDAPVAEIETAKAVVEVPSPFAGTVAELHGVAGETIDVGRPLLSVASPGSAGQQPPAGSGNVLVGYGTSTEARTGRRRRRPERPVPAAPAAPGTAERPRVKSPIVRRLARRHGIDLATLSGTGPEGLIVRADVERAARGASGADTTPTAPAPADVDARTGLRIRERVALRGTRGAIAEVLSRSRQEIPEATTWVDVDATELLELRPALATDRPAPRLLALIARFVVSGLQRFPALNARVDLERDEIQHLDGINLGIATQTERGLLVPAVRDAHRLSARGLDVEIGRLTAAARDGSITAGELTGGSFTLNNYGVLGVDGSAAIINHPEVAILGIGRILPRPWVVDGQIVPRRITQLSLVFDHRVCDGGTAAGFLKHVATAIEHPLTTLADL
jgi:pyruvate dehydrogenase E2 component (dihydrolipoamide acetyltransferase)